MSNKGDDCYFYFYSTCTKGDSCAFRHCEAALGNETICDLWQDGCCFRQSCKFRHMAIDKRRSSIPCYWENQISGCQKGNCAFHHSKGRFVGGVYLPPSKTQLPKPEPFEAELHTSQQSQAPSKLSVAPTPQLRGVKKIEATENVPSPTHPPVVINAADDDEDDDDQFSEEGDDWKNSTQQHQSPGGQQGPRVVSTRKSATPKKGATVYSNALGSSDKPQVTESNIPVIRMITFSDNDPPIRQRSLAQRLGKRENYPQDSPLAASGGGGQSPVKKKTLSERLGKKFTHPTDDPDVPLKKERAANPSADFRIKTLQEIRQEKANQKKEQNVTSLSFSKSEDNSSVKSKSLSKPQLPIHLRQLTNVQSQKKLRQLRDGVEKDENKADVKDWKTDKELETGVCKEGETQVNNMVDTTQKLESQSTFNLSVQGEKGIKRIMRDTNTISVDTKKPMSVSLKATKVSSQSIEQVRVKTLEEIRQEKALRRQQALKSESAEPVPEPQASSKNKKILRLSKPPAVDQAKIGDLQTSKNDIEGDAKTSVTSRPAISSPKKTTEPLEDDKSTSQSVSNTGSPDTQETKVQDGKDVESVKPAVLLLEQKTKGKRKLSKEASAGEKRSPIKSVIKRKAQENTIVAEVRPLSSTVICTEKKGVSILSVPEEPLVTNHSPKILTDRPQLSEPVSNSPSTVQPLAKLRRISTASAGKPSVATEDVFDDLIWGISDGKLEAEIDLDPSKDEDDLLMELSEMIDN